MDRVFDLNPANDPAPDQIPSFRYPDLSPYAQEMRGWETRNRIPGYDPKNHPYPRMLYRASRHLNAEGVPVGKLLVVDPEDEAFSRRNYFTVASEQEHRRALAEGWSDSVEDALKRATRDEDSLSVAAAHRLYEDKRLSETARAEARAADEEAFEHLPEIPEQPKTKRKAKQS